MKKSATYTNSSDDRNNKKNHYLQQKNYFLRDGKSLATTLRSKYKASDLLDLPD